MAIRRVDPKAVFKIVSRFDDSLEAEDEVPAKEGEPKPQTCYEKYIESFDLNELKFKEGLKPTLFHVRCLKASELAEINQKYQIVDTVKKTITYRDQNLMMLEIFDRAIIGVQEGDGSPMEKVSSDEVGFHIATEIGSMISLLTTLGKNLKKA